MQKKETEWVPTPTFLYRNYLYKKFSQSLPRDSFFLDVGAGNGEFVKYLINQGFHGESIDISKEAVQIVRKQLKGINRVNVKLADIFTYKTKVKYDVIFCFEALEHIENDQLAMKKIYQLLKPGGIFMMSVPAHMSKWDKMDEIKGHFRRYEKKELRKKLTNTGFTVLRIVCYGFPFLNIVRQITKKGDFITSSTLENSKSEKTKESSIQQEYNPKLKNIIANPIILYPLFKIMDLFIDGDLGFGLVAVAKKISD